MQRGYRKNYNARRQSAKKWRTGMKWAGAVSGAVGGFLLGNAPGAVGGYYTGRTLGRRSVYVPPRFRKRNITGSAPQRVVGSWPPYRPAGVYHHYKRRFYFKR